VSDAKGRVQVRWTLAAKPGEQVLTGVVRGTDVQSTLAVEAVAPPAPTAKATSAKPDERSSAPRKSGAKASAVTPGTSGTRAQARRRA
jgi:hypothetical protein